MAKRCERTGPARAVIVHVLFVKFAPKNKLFGISVNYSENQSEDFVCCVLGGESTVETDIHLGVFRCFTLPFLVSEKVVYDCVFGLADDVRCPIERRWQRCAVEPPVG